MAARAPTRRRRGARERSTAGGTPAGCRSPPRAPARAPRPGGSGRPVPCRHDHGDGVADRARVEQAGRRVDPACVGGDGPHGRVVDERPARGPAAHDGPRAGRRGRGRASRSAAAARPGQRGRRRHREHQGGTAATAAVRVRRRRVPLVRASGDEGDGVCAPVRRRRPARGCRRPRRPAPTRPRPRHGRGPRRGQRPAAARGSPARRARWRRRWWRSAATRAGGSSHQCSHRQRGPRGRGGAGEHRRQRGPGAAVGRPRPVGRPRRASRGWRGARGRPP